MAAAATLTFAIGAAGGMVTTAVMFAEPAASETAAATDVQGPATVVPAGYSEADLTALEQRLLQRLRADLVVELSARPVMPVNVVTPADQSAFERRIERQMLGYISAFTEDLGVANDRVTDVEDEWIRFKTSRGLGPGNN
jgi:hypothetical protein